MNVIRLAAQLRALPHRLGASKSMTPHVAVPGHFLQWLGIAEQELTRLCHEHGLKAFSYVEAPWSPAHEHAAVSLPCPDELGDTVTYATCVTTDSLPTELNASHAPASEMWRHRIATSYSQLLKRFQKQRPAVVLLVQGFEPHNAVARCAALRLNIPLIAVENTAIATRMVWDNVSGITTNRNVAKSYYWRYQGRQTAATCDTYCEQLIQNTKRLKSNEHRSPAAVHQGMPDRPTVLFLGQVYTDSSQVFGLRQWSSPLAVLQNCVRWCRRHNRNLMVKLHPKERTGNNTVDDRPYDRLTYRKIMQDKTLAADLQQLGAVIDEDNSYDTYELIQHCETAVTVNSQAGLEAAIRGKPVVVCGDAFYGGLDFTADAPGPAYFDCAMQSAGQSGSVRTASARRFAYVFFEEYCREKTAQTLLQLIEENL